MLPKVTILTPTNRPECLAQCAKYVARQTYPKEKLEWVIVNSCQKAPLVEPDAFELGMTVHTVSYVGPVGHLRNMGLQISSGELVVHFDDDDWHAPDRIEKQVAPFLVRPHVELVCTDDFHMGFFDTSPVVGTHSPAWGLELFSSGGTFMYRRKAWQKRPFVAMPTGEDYLFARAIRAANAQAAVNLRDPSLFICVRHGQNTCDVGKDLRDRATPEEGEWLRSLMGWSDFQATRALVKVAPPFDDQANDFERTTQK